MSMILEEDVTNSILVHVQPDVTYFQSMEFKLKFYVMILLY